MPSVEHAVRSDAGRARASNEDAWVVEPELGLYAVADGMGGRHAGGVAAGIVAGGLPSLARTRLSGIGDLDHQEAAARLARSLAELSVRLREGAAGQDGMDGMGAAVVVAIVRQEDVLITHMGDSRAYLSGGGALRSLTTDHSVAQLLVDGGELAAEDAQKHPARNQLTRFMGMPGQPLPETCRVALKTGERIILCTDGLTSMLPHEQIAAVLDRGRGLSETCDMLVEAANQAGGLDNVTVLMLSRGE
jgi:protein phosphatase